MWQYMVAGAALLSHEDKKPLSPQAQADAFAMYAFLIVVGLIVFIIVYQIIKFIIEIRKEKKREKRKENEKRKRN